MDEVARRLRALADRVEAAAVDHLSSDVTQSIVTSLGGAVAGIEDNMELLFGNSDIPVPPDVMRVRVAFTR